MEMRNRRAHASRRGTRTVRALASLSSASVATRVIVTFMMVMLILLAHNAVLLHYVAKTETYGPFLELAGRQRFLAQKLSFLIERGSKVQDARPAYLVHAIDVTMTSFHEALTVFERGGKIQGRTYPPAPIEASEAIRAQRDLWTKLKLQLQELTDRHNMPWPSRPIGKAQSLADKLTANSFGLVAKLESWRQRLRQNLRYSIIGTSLLALVTLLASLRFAWAKLVTPVRELRDEALRVSGNGFRKNPGDELDLVSSVVTEMSENVGRLRKERTQVERALRQVEADYQSVFDNAVAGIIQFNAAGELILANPAMARILGYSSTRQLAESIRNVHADMFADPDHESQVRALGERQATIESQTRMLRKDGSELWVLESSAVVRRTGQDYCCESVVVDVTEMKKAQESLRELSGLLLNSQEQERRRIARELHDSTGQILAALEINLSRLRDFAEGAMDTIATTSDLASQCSREIRSVSYLLHPPLLDELGLAHAVRDYTDGFSKRTGTEVTLDLPSDMERLSQDRETALFRVIQEALTNIHRHADSPVARIRLTVTPDSVVVEIEDEGRGIPRELLSSGVGSLSRMGVGMRGMEERLRQLGGRLTIRSDRNGTLVRGELPRVPYKPGTSRLNETTDIEADDHGVTDVPPPQPHEVRRRPEDAPHGPIAP